MTPEQLSDAVLAAATAELTGRGGDLDAAAVALERPRNPEHGDYASNIAMQLAAGAGLRPRELAEAIASRLAADPAVREVSVAGPGFLNIRLTAAATGAVAGTIVELGEAYGRGTALTGQRINLEFVSANPTGPLTLGHARWAAVGDALARLLRAQDADVTTEYYFNDAGVQIDKFAASLLAAARHQPVPADGYAGAYIGEIAAAITARNPGAADRPDAVAVFRAEGVALMFAEIKSSLADFGAVFDVYFSEQTLHDRNELASALARLDELGHVYGADGAVWVATTRFGDDKDRVFQRSDGAYSYFAADCAYYLDKRARGFGRVMIVLGADHHGYVGRMRAVAACFGDNPDATLEILIGQLVSLRRGGEQVRLSKRAGDVVTLADVVAAIGVDATRYALARYSLDSPIDIDEDRWARQSAENPVFYVQYAHARICSLLRTAAQVGLVPGGSYDPALLSHAQEQDLLRELADFPAVTARAAELRQPHRISRYLEQLAGRYHRFYDACRVLPEKRASHPPRPALTADANPAPEQSQARLGLAEATRIVLASGLGLLGVTTPDQM
jgi:arginyl-tRNA synthetase